MRISDWSSDVCSSDQTTAGSACACELRRARCRDFRSERNQSMTRLLFVSASALALAACAGKTPPPAIHYDAADFRAAVEEAEPAKPIEIVETPVRSEEHTSELQSLMRLSYAVFCLKKKKKTLNNIHQDQYKHKKQKTT